MHDSLHAQNAHGTAKSSQCKSSSEPTTSLLHAQLLPFTANSVNIHYYKHVTSVDMTAIPEVMSKFISQSRKDMNRQTPCQSNPCIVFTSLQNPHPD